MRLHQINKANYSSSIERDIIYSIAPSDKVLLIEDAIIRLMNKSDPLLNLIHQKKIDMYALESDLKAYGAVLPTYITPITDLEWVALTSECNHHIAW
ncbi:sulfurtransferase complex subunit TusB [Marinomonas sp. 2405UD68-3]|uniref:sulfurtransferase complex subunit TusB n=1 Tax=Marinomonas sp. 2405UD68-3 TaxID=3391835 RepID=UPI0039C9C59F